MFKKIYYQNPSILVKFILHLRMQEKCKYGIESVGFPFSNEGLKSISGLFGTVE